MDPEQFAAEYREAYPRLIVLAAGMTGDRSHAEDIVQQAVLIAMENLHQFQPGTSFLSWLSGIVSRCSVNHRRKTRNRKTFPTDPTLLHELVRRSDQHDRELPISDESGEISESQTAFDDELLAAINSLGDEQRCCLLLRIVLELSYSEIAEMLQIPPGTAMSHVHRGKHLLRRRLATRHLPSSGAVEPS